VPPWLGVAPQNHAASEALWAREHGAGSQVRISRRYRRGASTCSAADDAPPLARNTLGSPRVAHETTQHSLGFLELGAVGVGQARPRRVKAPPALEAPQALVTHSQARDARPGSARLAGLEVEEALEAGGLTGPVGLAFAAVEQDQARCAGADLVGGRPRAAPRRSTVSSRVARWGATTVPDSGRVLGRPAPAFGRRATAFRWGGGPLRSTTATSSAAGSTPR
jgi:hypothetical protein